MKKEQIQEFTRRITQANRSGLTLVTYDIFFAYAEDAKKMFAEENWQACKDALRGADRAVKELEDTLDFTYELAGQLYPLYRYCRDALAKCIYKKNLSDLKEAEQVMEKLRAGFAKAAESDDSAPLMTNTQQVYAGYTYGRDDLVESYQDSEKSRGFLA